MYFCSKKVLKQIPFVTVRLKFMAISFPQIKVQEQKFLKEVVVSLRLFDIILNTSSKNIHRPCYCSTTAATAAILATANIPTIYLLHSTLGIAFFLSFMITVWKLGAFVLKTVTMICHTMRDSKYYGVIKGGGGLYSKNLKRQKVFLRLQPLNCQQCIKYQQDSSKTSVDTMTSCIMVWKRALWLAGYWEQVID